MENIPHIPADISDCEWVKHSDRISRAELLSTYCELAAILIIV